MTNELYPCFYDKYRVTKSGMIYSDISKRFLKIKANMYGYMQTMIKVGGKNKNIRVHRLIAMTFIKNDDPLNKTQVNHINDDKKDNKVENLEWVTNQQNAKHAHLNGLNTTIHAANKNKKKLIDVITKQTFNSVGEAAKYINMASTRLSSMMTGKIKNTTKLKYHE